MSIVSRFTFDSFLLVNGHSVPVHSYSMLFSYTILMTLNMLSCLFYCYFAVNTLYFDINKSLVIFMYIDKVTIVYVCAACK